MPRAAEGGCPHAICRESIVSAAIVIVNDKPSVTDIMRLLERIAKQGYEIGVEASRKQMTFDVLEKE